MNRRHFLYLPLLVSCTKKSEVPLERYKLRGQVLNLDENARLAQIQHEKIDGWMEAMTMEFPVPGDEEWKKLSKGARITATVVVQDFRYHLQDIRVEP
jgi:Cu/Ag efflux protein CusF